MTDKTIDVDQLAVLAIRANVAVSEFRLQGLVVGLLTTNPNTHEDEIAAKTLHLEDTPGFDNEALTRFVVINRESLDGDGMDFELVPSEEDIAGRIQSMQLWLQGFLEGFSLDAPKEPEPDVIEIVEDFHVLNTTEVELTDLDADGLRKAEFQVEELLEHVRVSVLLLREYLH